MQCFNIQQMDECCLKVRFPQLFESDFVTLDFLCLQSDLCLSLCFCTDLVAQRGEKLELLIDKTENLVDSVSLRTSACYLESYLIHKYSH